MLQLADIQRDLRHAVVAGDEPRIATLLTGGQNPLKRLQIHRRHHETSLVTALLGKFPATIWLVGSPFVTEAARHYVRKTRRASPVSRSMERDFQGFSRLAPPPSASPIWKTSRGSNGTLARSLSRLIRATSPSKSFLQSLAMQSPAL